jgi:hypothetical protein
MKLVSILLTLFSLPVLAETTPQGLLGGAVQAGRHFQVEAGLDKRNLILFFLLNEKGVDSVSSDSGIGLIVQQGPKKYDVNCRVELDHFACPLPKKIKIKEGDKLLVNASRALSPFEEFSFQWPLPKVVVPEALPAGPGTKEMAELVKKKNAEKQKQVDQARPQPGAMAPVLMQLLQLGRKPAGSQGGGCELPP